MSSLIDVGCRVADLYHRYDEIHGAMFGAASFRLIVDQLRGRRRQAYREYAKTLTELRSELATLEPEIVALVATDAIKVTERELQQVLLEYLRVLDRAIVALLEIFENLERDEAAYRNTASDGRSGFTRAKLRYDQILFQLERLGARLNRLFAGY